VPTAGPGAPRAGPSHVRLCGVLCAGWLCSRATPPSPHALHRYILRRSKEGFRQAAHESDSAKLQQLWQRASSELEVVKRQSIVYQLYGRKHKNVLVSSGRIMWCRTQGGCPAAGAHKPSAALLLAAGGGRRRSEAARLAGESKAGPGWCTGVASCRRQHGVERPSSCSCSARQGRPGSMPRPSAASSLGCLQLSLLTVLLTLLHSMVGGVILESVQFTRVQFTRVAVTCSRLGLHNTS
jgi:hypothetical protein